MESGLFTFKFRSAYVLLRKAMLSGRLAPPPASSIAISEIRQGACPTVNLESTFARGDNQVSAVVDGQTVILNTTTGFYYALNNDIGTRVWELIQEPRKIAEVGKILRREYAVSQTMVIDALLELLRDFSEAGLLVQSPNQRYIETGMTIKVFLRFVFEAMHDDLALVIADLKHLRKEMRAAGASRLLISTVLARQVIASIVPIIWDGILRFVAATVGKIVKTVKGWW